MKVTAAGQLEPRRLHPVRFDCALIEVVQGGTVRDVRATAGVPTTNEPDMQAEGSDTIFSVHALEASLSRPGPLSRRPPSRRRRRKDDPDPVAIDEMMGGLLAAIVQRDAGASDPRPVSASSRTMSPPLSAHGEQSSDVNYTGDVEGVSDDRATPGDVEVDDDTLLQELLQAAPLDFDPPRQEYDDSPSLFGPRERRPAGPTWTPEPSGPPVKEQKPHVPVPAPIVNDPLPDDEAVIDEMVTDLLAGVPAPASEIIRRQAVSLARSSIRVQRLEEMVDRLHRTVGQTPSQCDHLHRKLAEMMMLLGGEIKMREGLWRLWSMAVALVAPRVIKVTVLRDEARRMGSRRS